MLKALMKKQFIELFRSYFVNRKTGQARSKGKVTGYFILFAVLILVLGATFFGMSYTLVGPFCSMGLDWLYFSLLGVLATLFGTFGSVFNTYAGVYHAKDNELLLSMPIKPSQILFARISGVYLLSLLYEAMVMLPAIICYWVNVSVSFTKVLFPLVLMIVLAFFISALTCLLGWIVALISGKLKNKSSITIILSLVFFALYYFVCLKFNNILTSLVVNAQEIGEKVKYIFPAYAFGMGCFGKPLYFIIFIIFSAVCFALTYLIMSESFVKITTTNKGQKKTVYVEKKSEAKSISQALFKKEVKRFTSSPTYFMNCGLGLFITPIISIVLLIKSKTIMEFLETAPFDIKAFLPVIVLCIIGLSCSLNNITAPSISLEGKNLWVLQSLPIDTCKIFQAKINVHLYLNSAAAVISAIIIGIAFELQIIDIVLICLALFVLIRVFGTLGIVLNLKMPNLTWTNEMIPIKQSMPVCICLFGGWAVSALIGLGYYLLRNTCNSTEYIVICVCIFTFLARLLDKWLKDKGTKIFNTL